MCEGLLFHQKVLLRESKENVHSKLDRKLCSRDAQCNNQARESADPIWRVLRVNISRCSLHNELPNNIRKICSQDDDQSLLACLSTLIYRYWGLGSLGKTVSRLSHLRYLQGSLSLLADAPAKLHRYNMKLSMAFYRNSFRGRRKEEELEADSMSSIPLLRASSAAPLSTHASLALCVDHCWSEDGICTLSCTWLFLCHRSGFSALFCIL